MSSDGVRSIDMTAAFEVVQRAIDHGIPESFPQLLTCGEVAEMAGVSRSTVTSWCKLGMLHSIKLGERSRRIRLRDLNAFLDQRAAAYSSR